MFCRCSSTTPSVLKVCYPSDVVGRLISLVTGSFIERKKIALTWHYRRADPEYGAYQARECQKQLEATVAKKWEVEVMTGKANLEVRPRFVNKGEIAKRLVKLYGADKEKPLGFVLCLGDDFTDEGKFRDAVFSPTARLTLHVLRHVPRPQAVGSTRRLCVLGHGRCELQTDSGELASPGAGRRHILHSAA